MKWAKAKARAAEILRGLRAELPARDVRLILRALQREFQISTMKPEIHDLQFDGHAVRAVLDHVTACDIIRTSGHAVPNIPEGFNTVEMLFRDAGGRPSLALVQGGFSREQRDDEREVNGCTVFILQRSTGDDHRDAEILQGLRKMIEGS
jgi:hypothetical protein